MPLTHGRRRNPDPALDRELAALEVFLNVSEETLGVSAVDDAMIEAQRKGRHLANLCVIKMPVSYNRPTSSLRKYF